MQRRIGNGYDIHRLVPGRLAGKEVEPMTICTESGEPQEPIFDGETPA
ncbi:hypothetical protein [Synechococcus sp. MIT S1220]